MPNNTPRRLLVTGGCGYIGSHLCVEALQQGHEVLVLDNLSNSSPKALQAVERITQKRVQFVEGDIREAQLLAKLFKEQQINAVLHFAGLKAVAESTSNPISYYDNNVAGTLNLLATMDSANVRKLVFSSSATVYGLPETMPLRETDPTGAINPYGQSKLTVEHILRDLHQSEPSWAISILRYFNPVGAHASGELGESPNGIPNNLMPYISQVAVGRRPHLNVYGDDYPTSDGTGVRDYIHVVDLARGHLRALEYLDQHGGLAVHNLGTGRGYSVLEAVRAFEQASGCSIPTKFAPRRNGDAATSYADPSLAESELGWRAEYDLAQMCEDAWRWQHRYPNGFD